MPQLQQADFDLFQMLKQTFLFLNRKLIQRVFTRSKTSTRDRLVWLVSQKYLERRYRASSFLDFQTPLFYLGPKAWRMLGNAPEAYKEYRSRIEQRSGMQLEHQLGVYDVLLKFMLEAKVKRIVQSEDTFWHESLTFEIIPDAWIQYEGGETFIEVDRGTESRDVVMRKLEKYTELNRSGRHKILFPDSTFRVLFITTTEQRIESLEQRTQSDDIWYATMEEFLREPLGHQHWFAQLGFYALPLVPQKEMQELRQA